MRWVILLFLPISVFSQNKCSVTISSKLANGIAYVGLYNSKESFPYKPYKTIEVNMSSSHVIRFNTNHNTLAFSCFIDENNDKKLNTFLGIPTEAYGFSHNNCKKSILPNFEHSLLKINTSCFIVLDVNKIL